MGNEWIRDILSFIFRIQKHNIAKKNIIYKRFVMRCDPIGFKYWPKLQTQSMKTIPFCIVYKQFYKDIILKTKSKYLILKQQSSLFAFEAHWEVCQYLTHSYSDSLHTWANPNIDLDNEVWSWKFHESSVIYYLLIFTKLMALKLCFFVQKFTIYK